MDQLRLEAIVEIINEEFFVYGHPLTVKILEQLLKLVDNSYVDNQKS